MDKNGWGELMEKNGNSNVGVINLTHAELLSLKNSGNLITGQFYKITDYQTIYIQPITNELKSGNVEPLIVFALDTNRLYNYAFSETHLTDEIIYDINNNIIVESVYDEYDGSNSGDFNISNLTANSFDVNTTFLIDEDFYLYCEDSNNDIEYDQYDYNLNFTITDLGGGNLRLTFSDGVIDFSDANIYIEMEVNRVRANRPGIITFRKHIDKNYSTHYDFRNVIFKRYKVDTTAIAYNNAINYSTRKIVFYNNQLYISIENNNLNHQPDTNPYYWMELFDVHFNDNYMLYSEHNYFIDMIPANLTESKDFYTFSDYDIATDTVIFRDDTVYNIEIDTAYSENYSNNVFLQGANNSKLRKNNNATFVENVANVNLYYSNDNIFYHTVQSSKLNSFRRNLVRNFNNNEFESAESNYFGNFTNNDVKNYFNYNIIYNMYNNVIKSGFKNNVIKKLLQFNTIEHYFRLNIINDNFTFNTIRNYFQNNNITGIFDKNKIADYFDDNTINRDFRFNDILSKFSNNSTQLFNYNTCSMDVRNNTFNDTFSNNSIRFCTNNTFNFFTDNTSYMNITNCTNIHMRHSVFNAELNICHFDNTRLIEYLTVNYVLYNKDFITSTDIYNNVNKEVMWGGGTTSVKLKYYNSIYNVVIVDVDN